jgi:hypothetical protein
VPSMNKDEHLSKQETVHFLVSPTLLVVVTWILSNKLRLTRFVETCLLARRRTRSFTGTNFFFLVFCDKVVCAEHVY